MKFEHAHDEEYADAGGGVVLHSARGYPGYPPRLAVELFERARALIGLDRVGLWDPMCGAGGLATSIALLRPDQLTRVLATDVDESALELAAKNLRLVTPAGLGVRRQELASRQAASERLLAADRLIERLSSTAPPPTAIARADATDAGALRALDLEGIDVVVADLPYGQQTAWASDASARRAFEALSDVLPSGAIITFSTTERDELRSLPDATRSFKHGRRHLRMWRVD